MTDPMASARAMAAQQLGLVTAAQLEHAGVTRGQLAHRVRSEKTRAVLPGVYLFDAQLHEATWSGLPLATRIAAARLLHGPPTVVCLTSGARFWRISGVGLDDGLVEVMLPPGRERHQVPGVRVHTRRYDAGDVVTIGGVRVTTPQRTVLDLVLAAASDDTRIPVHLRQERAVQILDSALNRGLIHPDDLELMRGRSRGRRGAAIARGWWDLADGRAQSPLETSVRLIAVNAKLPPDDLQVPICDRYGVLLGYGDLGWKLPRGRWLIAEADGSGPHELPSAVFRDRFRANDFAATGMVDLIRFTYADARKPAYIISQLRRHLG